MTETTEKTRGYAVATLAEIDEITDGRCPWRPVRHHLGISAFGVNAFTGRESGDRLINEHDEAEEQDLQEELYVVQAGRARFELDGEQLDAPTGTFVFVPPGVKRTAFAEEPGTTLLAIGARPGQAYEVHGWELWAPYQSLFQQGEYEQVADGARAAIEERPYPMPLYNLACAESLAGRTADAIAHLGLAIERSDECRRLAAEDSDFDAIRDEPGFKALVG